MIVSQARVPAIEGLQSRMLEKATYARFLLNGSYAQLSQAYPEAFSILAREKIRLRNDFCMEIGAKRSFRDA